MALDLASFESALIELEGLLRGSSALDADVFRWSVSAIRAIVPKAEVSIWLLEDERFHFQFSSHEIVGSQSQGEPEALKNYTAGLLARTHDLLITGANVCSGTDVVVLVNGVNQEPDSDAKAALATVLEFLTDHFRRGLLSHAEARIARADAYSQLFAAVASVDGTPARQFQIVSGLRILLNADRLTLLKKHGDHFAFACCSNSTTTDNNTPLRLLLAGSADELAQRSDKYVNLSLAEDAPVCLQQLKAAGVSHIYLIHSEQDDSHAFLLEAFTEPLAAADLLSLKSQVDRLMAMASLESASKQSNRKKYLQIGVAACVLLMASVLIPVSFEIEVRGQAFPVQRIHVFAPADGLIESLQVQNESRVSKGDLLAVVKNEKLTLEIQRAQGELSTEEARLLSMQRSRSSYSRSGESARFSEAATEQRIKDLKIQLQLLNLENERMNLCSGFDGVVVRSDLREELLLRPVRLGQSLFEVVADEGDWHLELEIPDEVVGYVSKAKASSENPL